MTYQPNKTLLRDGKRSWIEQIDELEDGELDEQKRTQTRNFVGTDEKVTNQAN